MIQLSTGDAIGLVLAFLTCVGVFGKVLLSMSERNSRDRFAALDERLQGVAKGMERIADIERDMMRMRLDFAEQYVRREDYVRGQTVIESKIDALASKIENLQLRAGAPNVR